MASQKAKFIHHRVHRDCRGHRERLTKSIIFLCALAVPLRSWLGLRLCDRIKENLFAKFIIVSFPSIAHFLPAINLIAKEQD